MNHKGDDSRPDTVTSRPKVLRRAIGRLAPNSVKGTLFLLLLSTFVPILLVAAGLFYVRFHARQAEEFQANLEVARAVAVAFDAYIDDILHQELAIGAALALPPFESPEQANRLLATSAREDPTVRAFHWVDTRGRIVSSSNPLAIALDVSDRSYAKQVLAGQEWAVSDMLIDRVTGEPAFTVARGIHDETGGLAGIMVVLVDPNALGNVLPVQRSGQSSIGITDRQGWGVYRYPEAGLAWTERDWGRGDPLLAQALAGREVTGTFVWAVDGQARVTGRVPIRSIGWVAGASRLEAEATRSMVEGIVWEAGLVFAIAVGALLMALILARNLTEPIAKLRQQAVRAGRGDFSQRVEVTKPTELRQLAGAFNRMADEINLREEQREGYIHTISHDLRGPLTIIQGQAQLVRRALSQAGLGPKEQASAEAILTTTRRMNALIQDLVDSARLDGGQLRLNMEPLDLASFVLDLKERLSGAMEAQRVRVEAPEGPPMVLADPDRMERILINLLSNALKYSPADSDVVVSFTKDDAVIVTSVADRGPGIPADELPRLFERYYRMKSTRGQREGIGLGLYITKALVEAHSGRIWVESELGRGSTFRFSLPSA